MILFSTNQIQPNKLYIITCLNTNTALTEKYEINGSLKDVKEFKREYAQPTKPSKGETYEVKELENYKKLLS